MNRVVIFFSSVFGVGYIKYIPGTLGSLIGILLWMLFVPDVCIFQIFMLGVIFIISVFFSSVAECIYKKKDDRRIVIDEVAGVWFSIAFLPKTLGVLFFGFVLFRFFDIKKPFFIKRLQKLKSGLGITMDDVMAGIFVNIILRLIRGIL